MWPFFVNPTGSELWKDIAMIITPRITVESQGKHADQTKQEPPTLRKKEIMSFKTQLFKSEHLILTWYDLEKDAAVEAGFSQDLDYAWRLDIDGVTHPLTTYEMKKKREEALKDSEEKGSSFCYAIRSQEDDRFLGVFVIPWVSWVNRDACFYLNFGDEADEERYFAEALHLTLRYLFEELGMYHSQTWLGSHDDRRVERYIQAGMAVEVRQRQMAYRQGRLWDRLLMGILQEDWLRSNAGE